MQPQPLLMDGVEANGSRTRIPVTPTGVWRLHDYGNRQVLELHVSYSELVDTTAYREYKLYLLYAKYPSKKPPKVLMESVERTVWANEDRLSIVHHNQCRASDGPN